jgi:RNA polymerase sigma factor (sigma-70 family)
MAARTREGTTNVDRIGGGAVGRATYRPSRSAGGDESPPYERVFGRKIQGGSTNQLGRGIGKPGIPLEKRKLACHNGQGAVRAAWVLGGLREAVGKTAKLFRGSFRLKVGKMSEPAVSTRAQAGGTDPSSEEFVRAFNAVRTELVSTLFFILGNHDDAQDAVQDAFLKCWRARRSLSEVRNVRAWIFRVGLNAAKDLQRNAWRRRVKPLQAASGSDDAALPSPAETLEDKESLERLRQALMTLRPEEKAVFLLRQNGDLTYDEIADLRRIPVGTVKTQMRQALLKLRRALKDK